MLNQPMKIDGDTRPYVRVAMRDTLQAYDLVDLLDVMAEICQENADNSRGTDRLGLTSNAWQQRADVLRDSAERLETGPAGAE